MATTTRKVRTVVMLAMCAAVVPAVAHANGATWTEVASGTTETISAIEYQSDSRFWFVTAAGKIYKRSGDTFALKKSAPGAVFNDIEFQESGNTGFAVGNAGVVYRSDDAGDTWSLVPTSSFHVSTAHCQSETSALGDVARVVFATEQIVYLLGPDVQIAKTRNVGSTWFDANRTPQNTCRVEPTFGYLSDAVFVPGSGGQTGYFLSPADYYLTGDDFATALTSRAFRQTWGVTGRPNRVAIDPANPNRMWSVSSYEGHADEWVVTNDGWGSGAAWDYRTADRHPRDRLYDLAYSGGTVLSAGHGGLVVNSNDGTRFFTADATGALATTDWQAAALASGAKGAIGGAGGKLAVSENAGAVPDLIKPTGTISGPANGAAGSDLTYTGSATDEPGGSGINEASLTWTVPGRPAVGGPTATFRFASPGTYTITFSFADRDGNAAAVSKTVTVTLPPGAAVLPKPTSLGVTTSKPTKVTLRGVRYFRISVRGRIGLPRGVSAAQGCSGKVRFTVESGGRRILRKTVRVNRRCRYRATLLVPRAKVRRLRVVLRARFMGNAALRARSYTLTLRLPR